MTKLTQPKPVTHRAKCTAPTPIHDMADRDGSIELRANVPRRNFSCSDTMAANGIDPPRSFNLQDPNTPVQALRT